MISCSVDFVVAGVDSSGVIEWTELGNTKHTNAFIFCHNKLQMSKKEVFYIHINAMHQMWFKTTTNRKACDEFHFTCKWEMDCKLHKKQARKNDRFIQVYDNKEEMKLQTATKKLYQDYLFF